MGEKLLLMLLSPLPIALQKLFFPYFPRNSNYLLLGEWAGLRIDNPITFPILPQYTSIVLVLRVRISRN